MSPPYANRGQVPDIQGRLSGATERDQKEKEEEAEPLPLLPSPPPPPRPTRAQAEATADSMDTVAALLCQMALALWGMDALVERSARHLDWRKELLGTAHARELYDTSLLPMAMRAEPKSSGEATIVTGKNSRGVGEFTGESPREMVMVGLPMMEEGIDTEGSDPTPPALADTPPYDQLRPTDVPENTVGLNGVTPGAGGVREHDTVRGG